MAGELLPTLSRAYIQKLIEDEKRITINGEETKPGYKVRIGDKLKIDFDPSELEQIEDIDLPVLYEDDAVLVVNKPAGVISHARGKFWNEPSVASFVRQKTGQSGERAGIVHRLDRATSGVMICAKNQTALSWLQKQFSQRKVKKTYIAVISGHMNESEAIIDMPIARNPNKPQTFHVSQTGKTAQTHYTVTSSTDLHSTLVLTPATGRTHQLRVHLKSLGHPIVGDELYGGEPAPRLMLHAYQLELTLPGGERKIFDAPLPPEFNEIA
jgi:23S rRNA pseudouridine1911/1915/1917 synthase